MGAPVGNQNAARAKKWTSAIERALCRRSGKQLAEALDDLAEKFIEAVEKGDLAAFREIGDRLEGKAAQSIALSGEVVLSKAVDLTDDQLAEIARASGSAQT